MTILSKGKNRLIKKIMTNIENVSTEENILKAKVKRITHPYQLCLYVDKDCKDRINLISQKKGWTKSEVVKRALEYYQRLSHPEFELTHTNYLFEL